MNIVLIIAFGYLLPAIFAKSLRAKIIYSLNAVILIWPFVNIYNQYLVNHFLERDFNFTPAEIFLISNWLFFAVFYSFLGLIKLFKRRKDILLLFNQKHDLNILNHIPKGALNKEEKLAFLLSLPGITVALYTIFQYLSIILI